ncbi:hypothetical protein OIU79_012233 [Salix purpurea]|uniref:Uncharacterized protein n=1 Tax=Salix purpurea TaxID=77065 RepID=A0A9Q0T2F3_SALPP|nr:hypothetical protein OIU79_012233 [Salix purpurea]
MKTVVFQLPGLVECSHYRTLLRSMRWKDGSSNGFVSAGKCTSDQLSGHGDPCHHCFNFENLSRAFSHVLTTTSGDMHVTFNSNPTKTFKPANSFTIEKLGSI